MTVAAHTTAIATEALAIGRITTAGAIAIAAIGRTTAIWVRASKPV
jgi:hypothetical protein